MATWQFDGFYAGSGAIVLPSVPQHEIVDTNILQQLRTLNRESISAASFEFLVENLGRESSWSPDLEIFGSFDGNRIDRAILSERECELSFRIDLREINGDFALKVFDFAQSNNLIIYQSATFKILTDYQSFRSAVLSSNARQFLDDPHDFLSRLGK